jgi:hypothetical protein
MKATRADAPLDRVRGDPDTSQLVERDNAVLVGGDPADDNIWSDGAFLAHTANKAPEAPISPRRLVAPVLYPAVTPNIPQLAPTVARTFPPAPHPLLPSPRRFL